MAEELWYSGVEPIEVGDLSEVKEQRTIVPATKNVRVKIKKAEVQINKENTFRQISMTVQLVNGIDETGKYKNKPLFSRVCYYADPNAYTSDYFKNRQHLVELKKLFKATGIEAKVVDGHLLEQLTQSPDVLCDITVRNRKRMIDDGAGNKMEVSEMENEVRNFKPIPLTDQV